MPVPVLLPVLVLLRDDVDVEELVPLAVLELVLVPVAVAVAVADDVEDSGGDKNNVTVIG